MRDDLESSLEPPSLRGEDAGKDADAVERAPATEALEGAVELDAEEPANRHGPERKGAVQGLDLESHKRLVSGEKGELLLRNHRERLLGPARNRENENREEEEEEEEG